MKRVGTVFINKDVTQLGKLSPHPADNGPVVLIVCVAAAVLAVIVGILLVKWWLKRRNKRKGSQGKNYSLHGCIQ